MRKHYEKLKEPMQRLFTELSEGRSKDIMKRHCGNCGIEFLTLANNFCSSKCESENLASGKEQIGMFKNDVNITNLRESVFQSNRDLKRLVGIFLKKYNLQVRKNRRLVNKHNQEIRKYQIPQYFQEEKYLKHSLYDEESHLEEIFNNIRKEMAIIKRARLKKDGKKEVRNKKHEDEIERM